MGSSVEGGDHAKHDDEESDSGVHLDAGFFEAQKPTEIKDSELKNLVKANPGADLEKSFRCGVFYIDPNEPAPEEGGRPAASLLIFNATWDAADECPGGNNERYKSFCNSIWDKVSKGGVLVLTSPSLNKNRAKEGITIGKDICEHLKNTVKAPFVGKNSKKFPDGIEFGMYSNACGVSEWTYTGVKHYEKVCCSRGEYEDCGTNLG